MEPLKISNWEEKFVKSKQELHMEARDYLERKIEKLEEEKIRIQNEIDKTKHLLETLPGIYD